MGEGGVSKPFSKCVYIFLWVTSFGVSAFLYYICVHANKEIEAFVINHDAINIFHRCFAFSNDGIVLE